MEDVKKVQEQTATQQEAPKTARRKLQKSFKSNTRIYDDPDFGNWQLKSFILIIAY